MKLSQTMKETLKKVAKGGWDGRPFQASNTNRTCEALEKRGLIAMADDQSIARLTLSFAWTITPEGREHLQ